tara:strand:+ start:2567 stop:2899 length:333 start_codon:yes stop_codon:yes gene_type:complete
MKTLTVEQRNALADRRAADRVKLGQVPNYEEAYHKLLSTTQEYFQKANGDQSLEPDRSTGMESELHYAIRAVLDRSYREVGEKHYSLHEDVIERLLNACNAVYMKEPTPS